MRKNVITIYLTPQQRIDLGEHADSFSIGPSTMCRSLIMKRIKNEEDLIDIDGSDTARTVHFSVRFNDEELQKLVNSSKQNKIMVAKAARMALIDQLEKDK